MVAYASKTIYDLNCNICQHNISEVVENGIDHSHYCNRCGFAQDCILDCITT